MNAVVRNTLFLLISAALLWYVLKDVSFTTLYGQFRRADAVRLLPVALTLLLNFFFRALRWQLALAGLGHRVSFKHTFAALMAGNLASLVVPGAGELTRCGTLQKTDGVPLSQGFGSVVAERVVDLGMLAVLIATALLVEARRLTGYFNGVVLPKLMTALTSPLLWLSLIAGVLVAIGLYYLLKRNGSPLAIRIKSILNGLKQGLLSIRTVQRPLWYLTLTVFIYGLALFATYLTFFSTDLFAGGGLRLALSIVAISALGGLAVPTQGGVGTYHALVRLVLVLYGYPTPTASVMATYLHAVLIGLTLFWTIAGFGYASWLLHNQPSRKQAAHP